MTPFENRMTRQIAKFDRFPGFMRQRLMSWAFGKVIKFAGTAGVSFDVVTSEEVVVSIANASKVQNHIKGVHAAAMALLAETATGFCVGMNLPDDKLPLIKSLKVNYLKRSQGSMRAVARLTEAQRQQIRTEPKGEVLVPVTVTDESGESPITCEMLWAWIPKKN
ncbi:DUF4442 domain-containing protein [Parachitinimonas caeni]|uniref:DUF4442 domain-containing protein n=1 Tax=Parachitinimonas caeni TaxID=3031301 RepID=A0ABT7DS01_9NEIS|nr:DUF4442 domain-containing protein [Parachitinimonas caeni]MDK2122850.1 DUF4442 domain-containing protein [Parachitinimonas caeni]